MTATSVHDVLLRPVISEKSTLETERNNYTFAVARSANKFLIKAAVEAEFKVKVLDVRVISVRPNVEAPLDAVLYVLSDANNTAQTPEGNSLIEIPLTVVGVDNGLPDIEVSPPRCDYGRVAFGGVEFVPGQTVWADEDGVVATRP